MTTADEILAEIEKRKNNEVLTADSILADIKSREDPGFIERFGRRGLDRIGQAKTIIGETAKGNQSVAQGAFQMAGQVGVGTVFDALGEGLASLPNRVKEGAAEFGGAAVDAAAGALDTTSKFLSGIPGVDFPDSEDVKAGFIWATEKWDEFEAESPRQARNVRAGTNIALALVPGPKAKLNPTGVTAKVGEKIIASGEKSAAKTRTKFVNDLVTPKQTPKTRLDQVGRTDVKGSFRQKSVVELSTQQKASAAVIEKIPTVAKKKTVQGNFNAVSDEVTRLAKGLESNLKAGGGTYKFEELNQIIKGVAERVAKEPELVGDAAKSASRVMDAAFEFMVAEERTLVGILKARKKFDAWVLERKPTIFDANASAMKTAVTAVRNEMNGFIISRAGNVSVRKSLDKQFSLLQAMDDIAVKAADEPMTLVGRIIHNAIRVIPIRNELVAAMGLAAGVGGLGAASMILPVIQKAGIALGIVYFGKKAIMAPVTRRALGELIIIMDKAIKKLTDPAQISRMRADRAALIEILNMPRGDPKELEQINQGVQ